MQNQLRRTAAIAAVLALTAPTAASAHPASKIRACAAAPAIQFAPAAKQRHARARHIVAVAARKISK
jgi:hypothetical protein